MMLIKTKKMELRAVQLDLARQMETVSYVCSFVDFASDFGYNAIALYLEARVKTISFPWRPAEQSYTLDDMARIVKHAARRGMDVIPIVSALSHCEQFLETGEMAYMAELREGGAGRFSSNPRDLCPSLPAVYEFFRAYYRELATVFPSPYFHAGCDEADDIGFCSLCRERIRKGESQSDLFAGHLRQIHKIVVGEMGKRMLIWDDMFEFYPDALQRTPRDIIMCCWQYDAVVERPMSHFGKRMRQDRFAMYDKLGFEYLQCPYNRHPHNPKTLHKYALRFSPSGGLMTVWENSTRFIYESLPVIAATGMLWSKSAAQPEADDTFREACLRIFNCDDEVFLTAVAAAQNLGQCQNIRDVGEYLRGSLTAYENEREKTVTHLEAVLRSFAGRMNTELGATVLEDMLQRLRIEQLQLHLRDALSELCLCRARNAMNSTRQVADRCGKLLEDILDVKHCRAAQWIRHRPGILPIHTDTFYDALKDNVEKLVDRVTSCSRMYVLRMDYFHADMYGLQKVCLSLKTERGVWQTVADCVPKPAALDPSQKPFFTILHPVFDMDMPVALRVESSGYGGIGIVHAEVEMPQGRLIPKNILVSHGMVLDPQALLKDDTLWCFIGNTDCTSPYRAMPDRNDMHSLEMGLATEFFDINE